jgi:four helix bundle protein
LALATYKATRAFPKEEIFGITAQMRRAAVSAASNIVEGCARNSEADYLHSWTSPSVPRVSLNTRHP